MSAKCSAARSAKRSILCVIVVASLLAGALPASAAPGPPLGPANPPTPANLVLWNRFETEQDVLTSEVGPDVQLVSYIYQNWDEAMIAPAQFGNGLFVNHDTGEGWTNDGANFFAADISQTTLSPEQGTIEFWFQFKYDFEHLQPRLLRPVWRQTRRPSPRLRDRHLPLFRGYGAKRWVERLGLWLLRQTLLFRHCLAESKHQHLPHYAQLLGGAWRLVAVYR